MQQIIKSFTKFRHYNKVSGMEYKRARIVACKALPNYQVWIRFDDGLEGEVDLKDLVGKGVFNAWCSVEFFNRVKIHSISDTLSWENEIDLDPYVLRDKLEKKQ